MSAGNAADLYSKTLVSNLGQDTGCTDFTQSLHTNIDRVYIIRQDLFLSVNPLSSDVVMSQHLKRR
jgi:hypothetical protein